MGEKNRCRVPVTVDVTIVVVMAILFLVIAYKGHVLTLLAPVLDPASIYGPQWYKLGIYQSFYGYLVAASVAFLAATITLLSAAVVLYATHATDRREARKVHEADIAFAYALRQECRQIIDQIPGITNGFANIVTSIRTSEYVTDGPKGDKVVPPDYIKPFAAQIVTAQPTMPTTLNEHESIGRLGGDLTERAYWFRSKISDAAKGALQMEKVINSPGVTAFALASIEGFVKGVSDELVETRRRGLILKDRLKDYLEARGMSVPTEE